MCVLLSFFRGREIEGRIRNLIDRHSHPPFLSQSFCLIGEGFSFGSFSLIRFRIAERAEAEKKGKYIDTEIFGFGKRPVGWRQHIISRRSRPLDTQKFPPSFPYPRVATAEFSEPCTHHFPHQDTKFFYARLRQRIYFLLLLLNKQKSSAHKQISHKSKKQKKS